VAKAKLVLTGQVVEASEEYIDRLIKEGLAEAPEAPKKATPSRSHRTPKKTAQRGSQPQE
jgi:hypothetical protein